MFAWSFSTRHRDEDEHWYDPDPTVRRKNLMLEEALESLRHSEPPRRDKEDSDVHPYIRYAVKVGIPSAMACVLLYWVLATVDKNAQLALTTMQTHTATTAIDFATVRVSQERSERLQEAVIALLRTQCVNTAKSAVERGECLRAGR